MIRTCNNRNAGTQCYRAESAVAAYSTFKDEAFIDTAYGTFSSSSQAAAFAIAAEDERFKQMSSASGQITIFMRVARDTELAIESSQPTIELANSKLYHVVGEDRDIMHPLWLSLKDKLIGHDDWEVWIDWYERRLSGEVRSEEIELAYVEIDDDLWRQGPATVNGHIKRRLEELGDEVLSSYLATANGGSLEITGSPATLIHHEFVDDDEEEKGLQSAQRHFRFVSRTARSLPIRSVISR